MYPKPYRFQSSVGISVHRRPAFPQDTIQLHRIAATTYYKHFLALPSLPALPTVTTAQGRASDCCCLSSCLGCPSSCISVNRGQTVLIPVSPAEAEGEGSPGGPCVPKGRRPFWHLPGPSSICVFPTGARRHFS